MHSIQMITYMHRYADICTDAQRIAYILKCLYIYIYTYARDGHENCAQFWMGWRNFIVTADNSWHVKRETNNDRNFQWRPVQWEPTITLSY